MRGALAATPPLSSVSRLGRVGTIEVSAQCESEVAGVTIDELMREALTLDPQGRAHLAHRLLDSLDELSEAQVEQLWLAEAACRDAEIDAGAATYSAEEVLARARRG
jgi:hypothetical protein